MKLIFKNIFLTVIIILIIAILSVIFVIKNKNNDYLKQETVSETYQSNQNTSSTLGEVWNNYSDERYGFSLDYPSNLNVHSIYENKVTVSKYLGGGYFIVNGGASFYQNDGYWIIIIDVLDKDNKVNVSSFEEWLKKESEKNKNLHQHVIVEKRTKIDGYDAIVTHMVSDFEGPDKYQKKVIFIKNGVLFEINIRLNDYEKVLNSFKFTK